MASGKAIVSTAVDGCREVLEDGNTGLLVPPRDPDALAAALARVADDAELRARLSRMARDASRRYDIGECVRRMEDLYDDVLRGRARALTMTVLGSLRQAWDLSEVPRDLALGRYPEFVHGGALPRGQVPVFVFHSLEAGDLPPEARVPARERLRHSVRRATTSGS